MTLLAALALPWFAAAPVPKADPVQEAKQAVQGEWKLAAYSREGQPEDAAEIAKATFFVRGDRMEITFRGDKESVTFALDPNASPPAIDFTQNRKDDKPLTIKGIYKLEKDRLTVCYVQEGSERPKEFASAPNSGSSLFVLERAKK